MRRLGLQPNDIDTVFVTHLHGDHFGGLPWLLVDAIYVSNRTRPLVVTGPRGIEARFLTAAEALYPDITKAKRSFELSFVEYEEQTPLAVGGVTVTPFEVKHPSGAPPYALRFEIDGKVLAFTGDTGWVEVLCEVARGADLFISECFQYDLTLPIHLDYATIDANYARLGAKRVLLTHMGEAMLANAGKCRCLALSARARRDDSRSMTSTARTAELESVLAAIRACRSCVEAPQGKPLPHEPRPVLRASSTARLAVCSQAPGTKVHASGTPFTDRSGDRLRDWMGVTPQEFYDEARLAIVPMGFCFPGQDDEGRRPAAAARMCRAVAPQTVRGAAAARARARGRLLRAKFPSRRGGGNVAARDDAGLADASEAQGAPARAAAAASLLAQQCVAQATIPGSKHELSAGAAPRGEKAALTFPLASRRKIIY